MNTLGKSVLQRQQRHRRGSNEAQARESLEGWGRASGFPTEGTGSRILRQVCCGRT